MGEDELEPHGCAAPIDPIAEGGDSKAISSMVGSSTATAPLAVPKCSQGGSGTLLVSAALLSLQICL